MEYDDQPSMKAQLGSLIGAGIVLALIVALVISVNEVGALTTVGTAIVLTAATAAVILWRRRALDAAHRAARRLAAYRLPPSRRPGEHRPAGRGRTAQLVPSTWRMPTPPAGVPTIREHTARRSVLALP